ncbi:hypothetical protein DH2020_001230 [Rehmannia glutinosa]|uniref:Uncharacterized protein n=1 Tax=Rehmannia glutinosa TaxID=99300 RepID=A0ABR0XZ47_REHGL
MENSSPLVLEISSDEEADFGDTRKGGGYGVGGGEFGDREDYDWLSKLLGEVGDGKDDDSDDVVLCHCYVCDSLAPCSHWGTGVASIDHCHATDKEEYWKAERKRMKKGDKSVPVIPNISNTSLLGAFIQTTQVPSFAPPQPNSCPVTAHLPFISSNVNVPNAVNQGRVHPSGCAVPIYRPRSQLVPLQSRRPCNNNVASRNKSHNAGSQLRVVFKRSGLVGASPNNSHAYGSQLSRDPLKRCRAFQTPVINGHIDSNQRNIGSRPGLPVQPQSKSPFLQSMNVGRASFSPPHSQLHPRPYSSCLIRDPIHSQPYVNRNFVSALSLQPQLHVASLPNVENFENLILPQPHVFQPNSSAPSQTVSSYQSDAGNAFGSELHSRFMISSNQNAGNNLENQSSQPQAHNNPSSLLFGIQNDFQGNHTQTGINESPDDFDLVWDSSLTHGNLQMHGEVSQCPSTAPADNSQIHDITRNDHHQSIEPVDSFHQHSVVPEDNSSLTNDADCKFPESVPPDTLDFQFDSWMFENQSLPGGLEVPVSPLWNAFSPEPASIDTGTLFDF